MSITLTDPRPQAITKSRWAFLIEDLRDISIAKTYVKLSLITIPAVLIQFYPPFYHVWLALPFVTLNLILHMGPYTLMLHNASHRRLFKRKFHFLNKAMTWVLGPFFGQTPETYYAHHIGMHHLEGNLPSDLSSTMKYQRDSFKHFLRYFLRFFFLGFFELVHYHYKKGNHQMMRRVILGESFWFFLVGFLLWFHWQATVTFFVLPLVLARFGMMAGNWAQHAFISPSAPDNDYQSSLTCINTPYNQNCFNDGYHISHHLEPSRHWSLHPEHLEQNYLLYEKNQAVVFKELDFFLVWLLLMLKQHKTLAKKMVTGSSMSLEQKIDFLKSRLKPFDNL